MPAQPYEFTRGHDVVFRRLANAMLFVGVSMSALSAIMLAATIYRMTVNGVSPLEAIAGMLGALLMLIGLNQMKASWNLQRIAATRGHDIDNLMSAVHEMTIVYGVERWLWIGVGVGIVAAAVAGSARL